MRRLGSENGSYGSGGSGMKIDRFHIPTDSNKSDTEECSCLVFQTVCCALSI